MQPFSRYFLVNLIDIRETKKAETVIIVKMFGRMTERKFSGIPLWQLIVVFVALRIKKQFWMK